MWALAMNAACEPLFPSRAPALVRRQLADTCLTRADAAPLRDGVSTDGITPVAILDHYDARLQVVVFEDRSSHLQVFLQYATTAVRDYCRGQVWLASPPTVMASALAGELVSWQQLRVRVQQASRRSTTSPQG